ISMYAQLDTYTALVTAGIRNTQPTFDYPQVFTPQISSIAQQAETICSGPLGQTFGAGMTQYATEHNGTLDGYTRTQPNFMAVPLVKTF
ncbi:alpha/beta hydrolase, partial [Acinetobacter baumannii]